MSTRQKYELSLISKNKLLYAKQTVITLLSRYTK